MKRWCASVLPAVTLAAAIAAEGGQLAPERGAPTPPQDTEKVEPKAALPEHPPSTSPKRPTVRVILPSPYSSPQR